MPEATQKKKKVRLRRVDQFKLDTWLHNHREEIAEGKHTMDSIASALCKQIPELNRLHVKYAMKCLGISSRATRGLNIRKRNRQIARYRKTVRAICRQQEAIIKALKTVGVDVEIDPQVQAVIDSLANA